MTRLLRNPRILAFLVGVGALFFAALLVPLPGPTQIQQWADSVGPWFPLLFFGVYSILAVAPLPRTVLTVSCGVLFGALLGTAVALSATVVAAGMALVLVRTLDRNRVASRLTHPAVRAIDDRLERRGWLAVGSLRLISFAPFSVVNYCCGLSSIRFWPYLAATFVGSAPGTIATVVLADALTGGSHPAMLVVSGVCLAIGLLGLVVDARWRPDIPAAPSEEPLVEALAARD
ncbi:TVP38/TMEM64 family protein [Nocardia amikacinitolerans]|uniref:TVP38/TMEM64 family protein n=1 Tax=Nocardia amikacinitolerans TaxID=756689 RepID=UPI0020A52B85|nr:TVP38/TMEM64 family protein [Nocardia amikacinitolerans]MCP2277829.1 putative membrane protein YdjX, TVP38/TMEM64 family, SNARE-associated domain [Nocardia amikacinitolerans]